MNTILRVGFGLILLLVGIILILKGIIELVVFIHSFDLQAVILLAMIYILCNVGLYVTGFNK